MVAGTLRVYGSELSYYTGKLEAYLRYKGIPHERLAMTTHLLRSRCRAPRVPHRCRRSSCPTAAG